ncbi:MAG: adenylate/guanylate cyclase domain-containing protein, partial [Acidimicrobiia bacterium]|nr:adenylate/guanylate cyclase domain-containing protein [Acidimicrobiia bacterium]
RAVQADRVGHVFGARLLELPGRDAWFVLETADIVLAELADFLAGQRVVTDVDRVLAPVMFTDIVGSTEHAARIGDRCWRNTLDTHDRVVRDQLARFRGHEIKTTGDGFFAFFDAPGRAVRCARAIRDALAALEITVRIGIHTGECEVRDDDLSGLAVHIAARVAALADSGEILVSSTVHDLVTGSGIAFDDRGPHALKGVPGAWTVFAERAP